MGARRGCSLRKKVPGKGHLCGTGTGTHNTVLQKRFANLPCDVVEESLGSETRLEVKAWESMTYPNQAGVIHVWEATQSQLAMGKEAHSIISR